LTREHGVSLRYSGAVVASPPILDTAAYAMAGAEIYEIEGVLNATTNYVLNSMAQGKAYKSALAEAQALGVAEANAKLDVEGFDSAAKLVIIANTVWGMELGLGDVDRHGITALNSRSVRESAAAGLHVRLVARAKMDGLKPLLTVRPEEVPGDHPFANLPGTSKAVRFRSRNMGDVSISGSAADVTAAAASALKDLIHILEERRPRHDYVVLTADLDYGQLLFQIQTRSPSVVTLRCDDLRPPALADHLIALLRKHEKDLREGALMVVDGVRARVRILPLCP
jgi:homoserine dehydrogenase